MKFKLKSKRLDRLRDLESQIILMTIYWEKPCWRVCYQGKAIEIGRLQHKPNYLNDGGDLLIDIFDTKKEAIEYLKKYGKTIVALSKDESHQITHFIDEKTGKWAAARIDYPKPYNGVLY